MTKSFFWKTYLLTVCASTLTVSLALIAGLLAVTDCFPLSVEPLELLPWCVLAALVSALIYSTPRASLRWASAVLLCGLLALYAWWKWEELVTGAQVVFHQISYEFHRELPSILYYDLPRPVAPRRMAQTSTDLFSVLLPLLALWLGPWLTLRWPVWPAVGTTAALVGLPLLLMRQPGPLALGTFLLFLALTVLARRGYRESPAAGARRTLAALLPAVMVLALLGAAVPKDFNPRPLWVEDFRLALQRIPSGDFSLGIGISRSSPPGKQSLRTAGPLNFDGRTALQINSSSTQSPLFLRGFSAGRYTAEGWEAVDDAADPYPADRQTAEDNVFLFPYQTQPYETAETIRITDLSSNTGYYYLPYYPSALPQDGVLMDDAYVKRPDSVDEYRISFLPQQDADASARRLSPYAESEYCQWVYRNYLEVPYDLLSGEAASMIRSFAGEHAVPVQADNGPFYDHSATFQAIRTLAADLRAYLASFTEYDQQTPRTPEGEDFVSWFLTQSHRGYCLHYASTATLMLRACGVPARYAAGYVARPGRANTVTNVPDRNAHAWVEVYVNGFGWQPVDVTPGFSGGGALDDPNAASPEPSPTPSATPSQTPTPTPAPTSTPSAAPSGPSGAAPTSPLQRLTAYLPLLWTVLGLLAAAGTVLLQRRLRLGRLRARCTQADPNRAALALYRYLLLLERRAGIPLPGEVFALAQKAAFSQHVLTPEELAAMRTFAQAAADRAMTLPLWRRLLLRYLWAVF